MRSCWGSWSYQCGTMVGTMAHHRIGWVIFRKDFEEFLNCFVETDVVWWLIWINRRTSEMGLKPPSISPGPIPNPRMLEQPGHGLHLGRSGTIHRIRCTFGSLTTSFHRSSRCGTWVVTGHCGFQRFHLGPFWLIAGLEMTGVFMRIGVGGWRHSFHGWQRGIGPRHQLHTDRKQTNMKPTPGLRHELICSILFFGWIAFHINYYGFWMKYQSQRHNVVSIFCMKSCCTRTELGRCSISCSCTAQVRLQVRLRDLQVAILAESAKHAPLAPCHQWSSRGLTV